MVTANHEDETRSVLGWFLSGSKQKGGNYRSLRSLLAEGDQGTSRINYKERSKSRYQRFARISDRSVTGGHVLRAAREETQQLVNAVH